MLKLNQNYQNKINVPNGKYFYNPHQFRVEEYIQEKTDYTGKINITNVVKVYIIINNESHQIFTLDSTYSVHDVQKLIQHEDKILIQSKNGNIFEYCDNGQYQWHTSGMDFMVDYDKIIDEYTNKWIQYANNPEMESNEDFEQKYGKKSIIAEQIGDCDCYINYEKNEVMIDNKKSNDSFERHQIMQNFPIIGVFAALPVEENHLIIMCQYSQKKHDVIFYDCATKEFLPLILRYRDLIDINSYKDKLKETQYLLYQYNNGIKPENIITEYYTDNFGNYEKYLEKDIVSFTIAVWSKKGCKWKVTKYNPINDNYDFETNNLEYIAKSKITKTKPVKIKKEFDSNIIKVLGQKYIIKYEGCNKENDHHYYILLPQKEETQEFDLTIETSTKKLNTNSSSIRYTVRKAAEQCIKYDQCSSVSKKLVLTR